MFDSTGTTSTVPGVDPFRQITYTFDFGDERGQTWGVSGKSKNTESGGPLAAHVFDEPGTYIVRVRASDPLGGRADTAAVVITVKDPNVVYAGTQTVCVSPTADYTGCPAGADHQTAYPSSWNGKRVLLHTGESFGDISILDGNSNVQVGAYGFSEKPPSVNSVGIGNWRPNTPAFATDITVMDLSVRNGINQCLGSRVLLYHNQVRTSGGGINIALGSEVYWARDDPYRFVPSSEFYNAHEIFMVENNALNPDNTSAQYGIFGSGSRVALLGNTLGKQQYHTIRLTAVQKGVIAHNEAQGINDSGIYHVIKIHSNGLEPYADSRINGYSGEGGWASNQVVVANNLIGNAADPNAWSVAIAPQNDQYTEGIENVLVENNRFVQGLYTSTDLVGGGRNLTSRGNTVTNGRNLTTAMGHDDALPPDWRGPYFVEH